MAGIELDGLDELYRALGRLPSRLEQAVRAGHLDLAERQAAQLRATAPRAPGETGRGTGKLAGKVRVTVGGPLFAGVIVGEEGETPYLGSYEFGNWRQSARPWVRPAAGAAEARHEAAMTQAAQRWLQ